MFLSFWDRNAKGSRMMPLLDFAGPFVERALLASSTSEPLLFHSGPFIPKLAEGEAADSST